MKPDNSRTVTRHICIQNWLQYIEKIGDKGKL